MVGPLRERRKDSNYHKAAFGLQEKIGRAWEEGSSGSDKHVNGADTVLKKMGYRLLVRYSRAARGRGLGFRPCCEW